MQVTQATEDHVSKHADAFAELIHATGPVTYDYQFVRRELQTPPQTELPN